MSDSSLRLVSVDDPKPAVALTQAAWTSEVVVVQSSSGDIPEQRLLELLTGPYGIGAVVPAPGGEEPAALSGRSGEPVARDLQPLENPPQVPAAAFRASLLRRRTLDPATVSSCVLSQALQLAAREGLRVVADSAWRAAWTTSPPSQQEPSPTSVLVLCEYLDAEPSTTPAGSATRLALDVGVATRDADTTVVVLDGRWSGPQAAALRSSGVEVVLGPRDWTNWLEERWGRFSHVVAAEPCRHHAAWEAVRRTQPQALKTLALTVLPWQELASLRPITNPQDLDGLEHCAAAVRERLAQDLRGIEIVVCESAEVAATLRTLRPGMVTVTVPAAVADTPPTCPPPPARRGLVILADRGFDVLSADEDAAVTALQEVVPRLRRRQPNLPVTVVSDWPSPMLSHAASCAGAKIVPAANAEAVCLKASLLLAAHSHGSGGARTVAEACRLRTPFVVTTHAAAGFDLGPLISMVCGSNSLELAARAERLLSDESHWERTKSLIERHLVPGQAGPTRAQAITLASTAMALSPPAQPRWPACQAAPDRRGRRPPPSASVRPPSTPQPPPLDGPPAEDEIRRYRQWRNRFGPIPEVLHAIFEDVSKAPYRPLVSVVVPVFDTEPEHLEAAIESVRAQIYDRWQLCIGDDHSSNPRTLAVLQALADDPRVKVVHLPEHGGISAATNAALCLAEGEFVAFMDHDDLLKPHALAQVVRWLNADPSTDVIYSDEDKLNSDGELVQPHLKPDWSPDLLMSQNYMSHLSVVRRSLVEQVGGLRSGFDGSQDYDLLLRVTELTDRVAHIPEPLYTWRMTTSSSAQNPVAKPYAVRAATRALAEALERRGYKGEVESAQVPYYYRVRYDIPGCPRVAVIIPTHDRVGLLRRCIESIDERSTYRNFELVIVDNRSSDPETLGYLTGLRARVIRYPHPFNYAQMMNLAARSVACDAYLFLNNDTEVISPEWMEALLEHAMRPEVGAVGARLYYPNGKVQHEGIFVGAFAGWAGNIDHGGYWSRGAIVRNVGAVTGACMMVRPSVFWRVGGNDERLRVAYNDVDLCLRIRQAGFQVVYTPYAELVHHESASRAGYEHPEDGPYFGVRWRPHHEIDPYVGPMFERGNPFKIRVE